MEASMADKGERKQNKQQGQTPNLGQKEAQQQQRGDSDLSQMGERTRADEGDKGKRQSE
jgi:transcription initiation factor TFIID subunit TAF12